MIVAAAALLALQTAQPATTPDSLEREHVVGALGAALDARLARFAEQGFAGTVLVARDGRVVLLKGYGLADRARRTPNGPATRFEQNSITKMFTGAAVLQLAAAGRLRLDDPVARFLGPFPDDKRGATIEQLAMHTAGLVVDGATLAGDTRDAFVRDVRNTPRESAPGARYRYTNAGFSLLAAVIERVTGAPYEDYLRRHLFPAAGMRTAVFRDEVPDGDPRFARGEVPQGPYVWGTRGAGGVWSTVGDIYRWVVAVEGGKVLGDAERAVLYRPAPPPALEAYGWHVERTPDGRPFINKGGGSAAFASQLLHYPQDRVTIVWASNDLRKRWRGTLNQALPEVVFGRAADR